MTLIRQRLVTKKNIEDEPFFKKIEELSLLLIRMTIQNNNFTVYSNTMLVYSCI